MIVTPPPSLFQLDTFHLSLKGKLSNPFNNYHISERTPSNIIAAVTIRNGSQSHSYPKEIYLFLLSTLLFTYLWSDSVLWPQHYPESLSSSEQQSWLWSLLQKSLLPRVLYKDALHSLFLKLMHFQTDILKCILLSCPQFTIQFWLTVSFRLSHSMPGGLWRRLIRHHSSIHIDKFFISKQLLKA